jgi:hypothetical protein
VFEAPRMTLTDFERVGVVTLLVNAAAAFLLNFASLLLVCFFFSPVPFPFPPLFFPHSP